MRGMDWKQLIAEIRGAGLTQSGIGFRIGKSQVWVSDVESGRYTDLKWADGQALIALHAEVTSAQKPIADQAAA